MGFLAVKTIVSAILIVLVSEMAKRSPAAGALVASLPLVSVIGMVWLWTETGDPERLASHASATLWYVLPSLPMFVTLPMMLRSGYGFWVSLVAGIVLTALLYLATAAILARFGVKL